jgi:DNA-binding beta-propeller fold protein YncE
VKQVLLALTLAAAALAAPPNYKLTNKIKIGGEGGWDYVYADSAAQRLYVSHATKVFVVDTSKGTVAGEIPDTLGVHGIAVASDLNRGFISAGRDNAVVVFDLKTLQTLSKIDVKGRNPDAIVYEPVSKRVFTFNGASKDATSIDAATGMVLATFPMEGKPEFAQVDGKGHIYVNNEDKAEIYEVDAQKNAVTKHYSIAPCESPSGLAMDTAKRRLFSVCENKIMVISNPDTGKVLGSVPIGAGADGVAFDDGYAFSSNGQDGTITVVGEAAAGKFEVAATVTTQRGARTIGVDPKTHKIYLPVADFGPPQEDKDGKKGRPSLIPGSFAVLELSR